MGGPSLGYTCMYQGISTRQDQAQLVLALRGCGSKPRVVAAPALLQTFVAGPPLQTIVADLCVEYCSLQAACRGGVCRRTPPSVTNLCREMAAQACYTANVLIRWHMAVSINSGVLFLGLSIIRALLFGVLIRASDFLETSTCIHKIFMKLYYGRYLGHEGGTPYHNFWGVCIHHKDTLSFGSHRHLDN